MKDLIIQYKYKVSQLNKEVKELNEEKELLKNIGADQRTVEESERFETLEIQCSAINSDIRNMKYSIEWMETGRRPGNMRGAENRTAYVDPNRLLFIKDIEPEEKSEEEMTLLESKVDEVLWFLTIFEKELFLLSYGYDFSDSEIAEITGKSTGTVAKTLHIARKKVEKNIKKDANFIWNCC